MAYKKRPKRIPEGYNTVNEFFNDLYRNEVSRLLINNSYLRLELEQNYSTFFKILREEDNNLFACSFQKCDFFFL